MLSSVEKYSGRRPGETWGELQSRSSYKDLVRQSLFRRKLMKSFWLIFRRVLIEICWRRWRIWEMCTRWFLRWEMEDLICQPISFSLRPKLTSDRLVLQTSWRIHSWIENHSHKVVLTGVKEASRTDSSPSFGKKIRNNPSVMDGILCKKEVFYFKFMLVRSDILYHRGESNIFLVQPEIRKKIHWKEETFCDNDLMKKM